MAIYHLSVKPVQRSAGRSATAAAAYRAGCQITDARTGEVHDYRRRTGVVSADIVLPDDVGMWSGEDPLAWARDRSALWSAAETAEKRKDACVAREIEVALPSELSPESRRALALDFALDMARREGCAVDVCIHAPGRDGDNRNHHAHMMRTTRQVNADGLGAKLATEQAGRKRSDDLDALRTRWADFCNNALARDGHAVRIDHRSLAEQGIDREPTQHLGPALSEMRRRGAESEVVRRRASEQQEQRGRQQQGHELETVDVTITGLESQITGLQAEQRAAEQAEAMARALAAAERMLARERQQQEQAQREQRERDERAAAALAAAEAGLAAAERRLQEQRAARAEREQAQAERAEAHERAQRIERIIDKEIEGGTMGVATPGGRRSGWSMKWVDWRARTLAEQGYQGEAMQRLAETTRVEQRVTGVRLTGRGVSIVDAGGMLAADVKEGMDMAATARITVDAAQAKGWTTIMLEGPREYQEAVAREAQRAGIPCQMTPDVIAAIERDRQRAQAAQAQAAAERVAQERARILAEHRAARERDYQAQQAQAQAAQRAQAQAAAAAIERERERERERLQWWRQPGTTLSIAGRPVLDVHGAHGDTVDVETPEGRLSVNYGLISVRVAGDRPGDQIRSWLTEQGRAEAAEAQRARAVAESARGRSPAEMSDEQRYCVMRESERDAEARAARQRRHEREMAKAAKQQRRGPEMGR